jgi:hypothetical protein
LRQYGIAAVVGDNHAGAWPQERSAAHGISYRVSERTRSALYLELLPSINSGRIELLDNPQLINQICALERRIERSGRETLNHPDGGPTTTSPIASQAHRWKSWPALAARRRRAAFGSCFGRTRRALVWPRQYAAAARSPRRIVASRQSSFAVAGGFATAKAGDPSAFPP